MKRRIIATDDTQPALGYRMRAELRGCEMVRIHILPVTVNGQTTAIRITELAEDWSASLAEVTR